MERTFAWSPHARIEPKNRLLASLPDEVQSTLQPHLKTAALPRGGVLYEADAPLTRVYTMLFLTTIQLVGIQIKE
jgi:hypothetical protein